MVMYCFGSNDYYDVFHVDMGFTSKPISPTSHFPLLDIPIFQTHWEAMKPSWFSCLESPSLYGKYQCRHRITTAFRSLSRVRSVDSCSKHRVVSLALLYHGFMAAIFQISQHGNFIHFFNHVTRSGLSSNERNQFEPQTCLMP